MDETEFELRNFLKLVIENEVACEALKQRLCSRKNYNVKNVFILLDTDEDGFLDNFEVFF